MSHSVIAALFDYSSPTPTQTTDLYRSARERTSPDRRTRPSGPDAKLCSPGERANGQPKT
jgi:hypothetical protein